MILFSDSDDFQGYVPINKGFDLNSFEKYIENAFEIDVLPYLSEEQFSESSTNTDANHIRLIEYVKRATANLSVFRFFHLLKVVIDTTGITYSIDRSKQATNADKADAKNQLLQSGHESLDLMLRHLEKNKNAFTQWANSTACTLYNDCFVRNADEAGFINGSRLMFLELRPHLLLLQNAVFKKALTPALFTDLKERLKAGTLTGVKLELVKEYIRPCLSLMACASAAEKRNTELLKEDINNEFSLSLKDHVYRVLNNPESLKSDADLVYLAMVEFLESNKVELGIDTDTKVLKTPFRNTPGSASVFI